jgi:GNAT superfamily N-acetyltransferase
MFKKYLKEKYNRETIENEYGFISYNMYDDASCIIQILWIEEEARNQGKGKSLEKALIEKENPWIIFCDVDKYSNGWKETLEIIKKGGYQVYKDFEEKIVLYKEIKDGKIR